MTNILKFIGHNVDNHIYTSITLYIIEFTEFLSEIKYGSGKAI